MSADQTQSGPSCCCPVVLVPIGGPSSMSPVLMVRVPPPTTIANRSSPRGAGPAFFSPTRLYFEPWQGHSNHCEVWHHGTRQPRCTQRWYSATNPASIPEYVTALYTFFAAGRSVAGYCWT